MSVSKDSRRSRSNVSRRDILRYGAGGVAALALPSAAFGKGMFGRGVSAALLAGPKYMLVDRITFGATPTETALFDKLGWGGYLEHHLNPAAIDESNLDSLLTAFPTLTSTPYQCLKVFSYQNGYEPGWEAQQAQLLRPTLANRQFLEVMTEFWLDHFNVSTLGLWDVFIPEYVRIIRANAFGNFRTLLGSIVKSGGMLWYLNNIDNRLSNHNENFARELLELHTLGVEGGYWEGDIYTARRGFTGWSTVGVDTPFPNVTDPAWGEFQYRDDLHDYEGGVFLNQSLQLNGIAQGEKILDILAANPNTAYHVCYKLCQRFQSHTPNPTMVHAAASVFLSSKGDIKSVLRTILSQANLTTYHAPKLKRPLRFVVSAMRAVNCDIYAPDGLLESVMIPAGMLPFGWRAPNGYPDTFDAWSDNFLPRWRFAMEFAANQIWGAASDPFVDMPQRTAVGVADYINKYLFAGSLSTNRFNNYRYFLTAQNPTDSQIRDAIGLALTSPEFQYY